MDWNNPEEVRQYKCAWAQKHKEKHLESNRQYYQTHKKQKADYQREYRKSMLDERIPKYREMRKRNQEDRRQRALKFVNDYKASFGCGICGEKNPVCLDLHHRDPSTKVAAVGTLAALANIKKIQAELPKCAVICSNCHRKYHAGEVTLE